MSLNIFINLRKSNKKKIKRMFGSYSKNGFLIEKGNTIFFTLDNFFNIFFF